MCLILIAYRTSQDRPLIVAANRDEFHSRPTEIASFWQDAPSVFAGRDLEANGTWLGVSRTGRFAAVANWADSYGKARHTLSRGTLPRSFLESEEKTLGFVARINGNQFQGYNLVMFDGETLVYTSNRTGEVRTLGAGIYGVSNSGFRSPDGRAETGRVSLKSVLRTANRSELIAMLEQGRDRPCEVSPPTRFENEPTPSTLFLNGKDFGTRACTTVIFGRTQIRFHEQSYGPSGEPNQCVRVNIPMQYTGERPTSD